MKFTKEEISLCKQVAEKHRKDLKISMYVWREFDKTVQLIYKLDEEGKDIYTVILETGKPQKPQKYYWNNLEGGWLTPLWTISDCLEFLREKGFRYDLQDYCVSPNDLIYVIMSGGKRNVNRLTFDGKTPLEACLKAVLAVLEEDK